jgi:DtxR family Mn-dependent transcriptional regulator
MLRYLSERGILPGAALEVRERQPFGGPLTVGIAGAEHAIGGELAERMVVEVGG